MAHRRAQGSAATVIGIIALLFIFYILFIPPEDRAKLLFETDENGSLIDGSTTTERTLLLADVGRLDYIPEDSYDHDLPNVVLTQSRSAQVLTTFSPFVLRRSWLTNKGKELTFNILDPDKTDNVLLVFEAPVRSGILTVWLNEQVIYEATIDSQTPPPIVLRRAQLSQTNTLRFELSSVGLAFWESHEMQFRNVQIIGDVRDERFQRSSSVFTLRKSEARNLEEAMLYLFAICDRTKAGVLDVYVNDMRVYSAKPLCDSINKIELDTDNLRVGANKLQLSTTAGTIRVEQLRVHTQLKETKSFIEYFELNQTDMNRVEEDRRDVNLYIDFVDDGEDKRGVININGRLTTFDQTNASFVKEISTLVRDGNNYLELRPDTVLNIVELRVELE